MIEKLAESTMPTGTTSGTPQVLLGHHLKQLKLPTVLREYDKVARECARDGVDHPRYLLRLVELELIDRERRVVERRIWQARFPAVKSLDTFDFTAIPGLIKMGQIFSDQKKMVAGENFTIDWIPGTGTLITVKGKQQGEPFKEPEFYAALMRIWLGPSPADFKLKDALLGKAS